jgi:hypothetical protein
VDELLEEVEAEELNERVDPKKCGLGAFPMITPTERQG